MNTVRRLWCAFWRRILGLLALHPMLILACVFATMLSTPICRPPASSRGDAICAYAS